MAYVGTLLDHVADLIIHLMNNMQVLRQQLDMLQHQVSQLSMHRQHWHQQQQEQAAIAASAEDTPEAGPSSSTDPASPSHQAPAPGADAPGNGRQNVG